MKVGATLVGLELLAVACATPAASPVQTMAVKPPTPKSPEVFMGQMLTQGAPVTREIRAGEMHAYGIATEAGQVVYGGVEQRGVDVVVTVVDPKGKKLREIDSPTGTQGVEPFHIQSEVGGTYQIEVRPVGEPGYDAFAGKGVGTYEARIDEVLTAAEAAERVAKDAIASPRLFALWKALRDGGAAEEERFWQEMKGKTPLIEPIADGPGDEVRMSFLWRGAGPYVGLAGGPGSPEEKPLVRLGASDTWYFTTRIPKDSRFGYGFVVADGPFVIRDRPPRPDEFRAPVVDPQNPNRTGPFSVVELPDAPKGPLYGQPGTPKGRFVTEKLHSDALGQDREVTVYLPPGLEAAKGPHPLLLAFDAQPYGAGPLPPLIPLPALVDHLVEAHELPPTVVALVPNGPGKRMEELGLSVPFADFIGKEVIPMLRKKWNVDPRPAFVTLTGSSLGGLASAFVAFHHPEAVGNVLSQSGSFQFSPRDPKATGAKPPEPGVFIRDFAAAPKKNIHFYLEAGAFESGGASLMALGGMSLLGSNRHMRDVLVAKGYPVAYREYAAGHDYICWRESLADGLRALEAMRAQPKRFTASP